MIKTPDATSATPSAVCARSILAIPFLESLASKEALDLTAYLLSLDRTYPAPEDGIRDDGYRPRGDAE